jgi:hypothetical protein
MPIPSVYAIHDILFDETSCVEYLRQRGVFYEDRRCDRCGDKAMKYDASRFRFRCTSKGCSNEIPLRKNTFFQTHRLPMHKIVHLGYLWLKKDGAGSMGIATKHAKQTVTDFSAYFRGLVADSLDEVDMVIGGQGIDVEIDETKMG